MKKTKMMDELIKKVKKMGIDPEKTVYSLTVADILECAVEMLGVRVLNMSSSEIDEVIEVGREACSELCWSDVVSYNIHENFKDNT